MSFLRSVGSRALAWRVKRSSILGSENRPQLLLSPVVYRSRNWSGSSMKLNEGLTISSKLPVSRPSANQDADSRGRCSTSMPDLAPLLDHEHAEVDVRDSDVAVFQDRFESVGVTGLGQEAFGLGAILLHVLPEARKLLQLGVRHRPLRRRTHQPADVLETRDGVEHATRGVPIETQRQRLTDTFVVEGLDRLVHRDAEDAGGRGILHDHLVAELLPDRLDLRLRHGAELDVRAPVANGRRAHRCLRADEELVAVEIRSVLDEVVGVALALARVAARVALELEGPGPDDVRLEVVRILVEVLLRIDHVPRRGQVGQE